MSRSDSKKKKKIPNKRLLILSVSLSAIIIFGFVTYKMIFQNQQVKFSMKAAIVDQLSKHYLNPTFNSTATNLLKNAGFNLSYFSYKDVTVPFYKQLIESNYGIIIFRVHSALRNNTNIVDLFTSETYKENKYPEYNGLLSKAEYLAPFGNETGGFYFAITPEFIKRFGSFPHSIIIIMGCSSLKVNCYGMAQAFIDKGAKAYVGWTEVVLPDDTDQDTVMFLDMLLSKNRTLATAIDVTKPPHHYYDPKLKIDVWSEMSFYPSSAINLKISDLIAEAKSSNASMTFNSLERFSFLIASVNFRSKHFL